MSRRASLVARELLPWLAPLLLAAGALLLLPRFVLPRPPAPRALPPPRADSVTLPAPVITPPVARPPAPRPSPSPSPAPAPSPIAPPGDFPPPLPALGGRVLPPPRITPGDAGRADLPRAWTRVNHLRAWTTSARDGGVGPATQNALLRNEIALILEDAGFGEEPFASRVRAWREAAGDGGDALAPRERFFLPEDAERLRVWDAVRAIEGGSR
ncbi:MAG: hypothetical protein U0325_06245 [Polyangiales bacterium]